MWKSIAGRLGRHLFLDSVIVRNAVFLLVAEFLRVLVTFYLSIRLGRYLEPEGQGRWRFVVNYAIVLAVLTDAGISRVMVRRIARSARTELANLFELLFSTRIALAAVTLVALATSFALVPTQRLDLETRMLITLYMGSQIFQAFRKNAEVVWQGTQQLHYHAIFAIANRLLMLPTILAAIRFHASLRTIVFLYVLIDLLDFLSATIVLHRQGLRCGLTRRWSAVPGLLREGYPFALQFYAQHLRYYFDVVLLRFVLPEAGAACDRLLGWYSVATSFVVPLQFIPTSLAGALYPELAHCYVTNRPRFQQLARTAITLCFLLGTSFQMIFVFAGSWIVSATFGHKFAEATPILQIFAWQMPFFFLSNLLLVVYAACDRQGPLAAFNWSATVLKILSFVVLVPRFGIYGAAYVAVVSEVLGASLLLLYLACRERGAVAWRLLCLVAAGQGVFYAALSRLSGQLLPTLALLVVQLIAAAAITTRAVRSVRLGQQQKTAGDDSTLDLQHE